MLPPWPSPLRHSHPCLSPIYARSVFEGRFEFLRPSVGGTLTTHSEVLLIRVGALPCAPTYYTRGLQSFGAYTATRMQLEGRNVPCKQYCCASGLQLTASNNLYRVRNCCTTHAAKATYRYFLGTRLRLPRRVTLERVPTGWYFLFSACGVNVLSPRPLPLQLDIQWEFKPLF